MFLNHKKFIFEQKKIRTDKIYKHLAPIVSENIQSHGGQTYYPRFNTNHNNYHAYNDRRNSGNGKKGTVKNHTTTQYHLMQDI